MLCKKFGMFCLTFSTSNIYACLHLDLFTTKCNISCNAPYFTEAGLGET
jgi:hypothetical protein